MEGHREGELDPREQDCIAEVGHIASHRYSAWAVPGLAFQVNWH